MAIPGLINYNQATNTITPKAVVNPELPDAQIYTPAKAEEAKWNVDTPQTVLGQMNNITASGTPYMQQAETAAKQAMAPRGLLNTTMAVTAGQDAAYRAALPMAQQDASTFANAGQSNAANLQQANLFNAESQSQAGQFGAQQANAMNITKAQLEADTQKFNVGQTNAIMLSQIDQINQTAMQVLKGEQAQSLAATEAAYKTQIQNSDSAAKFYSQIVASMTASQTATGTTAEQKEAAATYYNSALRNGMAIISGAGNSAIDLTSLLSFNNDGTPITTAAPAAAPAAEPTSFVGKAFSRGARGRAYRDRY